MDNTHIASIVHHPDWGPQLSAHDPSLEKVKAEILKELWANVDKARLNFIFDGAQLARGPVTTNIWVKVTPGSEEDKEMFSLLDGEYNCFLFL